MMSFALYILATTISIQFVTSQGPEPVPQTPGIDQQVPVDVAPPLPPAPPAVAELAPVVEPPVDVTPALPDVAAPATPSIPVCDGSQVIYATPASMDMVTGMITGSGLDAITLSLDGINTFVSNRIGITSDPTQLLPDAPEMEIIRSSSINPMTSDLVLLYQEYDPMNPGMSEPQQRLILIPGFKLKALLVQDPTIAEQTPPQAGTPVVGGPEAGLPQQSAPAQRPGILGYEMLDQIDLSEVEIGDQIPLTEIAFDCAGNLLGVTMDGEMVQMIIEPGSSNLEYNYIGKVKFEGLIELSQGFVGLTYDFQTNNFVTIGGMGGKTLVQFQTNDCIVMQIGDPIIITDINNLCMNGISDIASRGNNQYYIACVDATGGFGLAVLELQGQTATILPLNAAQGATLVSLPNSSGGALIPSIPSTSGNTVCLPRSIGTGMCNVLPADTNCEGDVQMEKVLIPTVAAPGAGVVPPPPAANGQVGTGALPGLSVNAGPVSGNVGGVPQMNGGYVENANGQQGGTYYTGYQGGQSNVNGAAGGYATNGYEANSYRHGNEQYAQANGNGEQAGASLNGAQAGANGASHGEGSNGSGSGSGSGSSSSGNSGNSVSSASSGNSGSSSSSGSSTSSGSPSDDATGSSSSSSDSSGDSSDDSGDNSTSDGDDDDSSSSDDSSDDDSDDSDDSSGSGTESGDDSGDNSSSGDDEDEDDDDEDDDDEGDDASSDGASDDGNSKDDSGDESTDDDDQDSVSSESSEEVSAEDAQSYGNDFNRNGYVAADYASNGNGNVISLSSSTLANLWGLAMIFLGLNMTFLFICYYRNGNCRKNQVTMDDDMDADVESL